MKLFIEGLKIASSAHQGQARSNGQPFFNHCLSVASRLHDALVHAWGRVEPHRDLGELYDRVFMVPEGHGVMPPYIVSYDQFMAAVVLHDVPEDCPPEWQENIRLLDRTVHQIAMQLRNPSCDMPRDTPREVQKAADFAHVADHGSQFAALAKACDRLDNCLSAAAAWRLERRHRYAGESDTLRAIIRGKLEKSREPLLMVAWEHLDPQLGQAIADLRVGT